MQTHQGMAQWGPPTSCEGPHDTGAEVAQLNAHVGLRSSGLVVRIQAALRILKQQSMRSCISVCASLIMRQPSPHMRVQPAEGKQLLFARGACSLEELAM